jgi:hypothetical protein
MDPFPGRSDRKFDSMLDRLRKRFENLIAGKSAPVLEEAPPEEGPAPEGESPVDAAPANDVAAILQARREAQKRESRLILTERIHNRAASLLNELRTELVTDIHRRLEGEVQNQSLNDLLQVTLDTGFTTRLDASIVELVEKLFQKLRAEFQGETEAEHFFPGRDRFVSELKSYRDQVLRKHVLEQVEVLALPTSAEAFSEERGNADELKDRISQYWSACRDALDKFFRSVEMVLLDGARPGIRIESSVIRDRLLAAQYRNGYRLLDDRFKALYSEIARLHMSAEPQDKQRAALDRRVVDEIIVPLAYFIRERTETEPREALASRAELFSELVDKLVVIPEPFLQTAEAIKPVLRKSVEQARPIAAADFPYLRATIESLNPAAIHRTTALLRVLEVLVEPELDERALDGVVQIIRLNRAQYRLYQQLERSHPRIARDVGPLDRIWDDDATLIAEIVEQTEPSSELVEDLFLALGYFSWPDPLPEDPRKLLRLVAVLALNPKELGALPALYSSEPPDPQTRSRLAQALLDQVSSSSVSVGADERSRRLGAVPLPIDLSKALASMGYRSDEKERLGPFREEMRAAVEAGDTSGLVAVIQRVRTLQKTIVRERVSLGATGTDAHPYLVEIWLTPDGTMMGLVLFDGTGFGAAPVESLSRDPSNGNRKETEEKLRRQLQSQALIYQTFFKLFSRRKLLSKERRKALPSFVKTLYEPTDPNRLLLLARLRYAKELVALTESFAQQIGEAEASDAKATGEASGVVQILSGISRKVDELIRATDKSRDPQELARLVKEYERALKYLNTVVVHSVNPWLLHQTSELGWEFEFKKEDVENAVRRYTARHGLDWKDDIVGFEAHGIRGTLGCRALLKLADGTSKVVLLNYDRKRQEWQVRHMGPRLTDVVREALRQRGKSMPDDYDEKFEQPTFRLDEQSCRFLLVKRDVARVEATLVLDAASEENPWRVVYLRHNDDVLVDRLS